MVATALDPLGVDVKIDVETPNGERFTVNGRDPNKPDEAAAEVAKAADETKEATPEATMEAEKPKEAEDREEEDCEEAFKDVAKASSQGWHCEFSVIVKFTYVETSPNGLLLTLGRFSKISRSIPNFLGYFQQSKTCIILTKHGLGDFLHAHLVALPVSSSC
jgi:hypothetical protein